MTTSNRIRLDDLGRMAVGDKVATRRTDDGLPVHSFRTLLDDLATLCLNKLSLPSNPSYRFDMPTTPTPLQARALELLGVANAV